MLKNYFKIAYRNLVRQKSFSALNIIGLTIGMAASIFILLWVQHEQSYDHFHKHADHIYRVTAEASEDFHAAINNATMPLALQATAPAIQKVLRISHPSKNILTYGDAIYEEERGFFVDSTFFDFFSFPLLEGNATTALLRPDAILLTKSLAKKFFGNRSPLGQTLKMNNEQLVTVTGVLADLPRNSHFQFNYLMPISAIAKTDKDIVTGTWRNFNFYAYLLFNKHFDGSKAHIEAFERQMNALYKAHEQQMKVNFHLQPLTDIHLHSHLQIELDDNGNLQYVQILSLVAFFILGLACINFMNLTTARSINRAKEVGLRKVMGSLRKQLVSQFLTESVCMSLLSLILAVGLVKLTLPLLNELTAQDLTLALLHGKTITRLLAIALITGLVSGSYPALYLSGFRPVNVLKGRTLFGKNDSLTFRNTLVVLQFVLAMLLLTGTVAIYQQLAYIKKMNLGFNRSNLLYVPMRGSLYDKFDAYQHELAQNTLTAQFAITNILPTNVMTGSVHVQWEGKDPNRQPIIPDMSVSSRFFDVFQMKMVAGRTFLPNSQADSSNFIINEKMAHLMGYDPSAAIGKSLTFGSRLGQIVGVVKDFNFKPIQQTIEPLVIKPNDYGGNVIVRTQPGKTEATIKALKRINETIDPNSPFSFGFLDQDLNNHYQAEQRMGNLFNLFAILAIFISCLGLYGLSAFMTEQRFKEIGIRKVLGATTTGIVSLLSKRFIRLICLAILIALPIAWYGVNSWLNNFAYHISVGWFVFAGSALTLLSIALLTVSYESIRAALANPVKSLHNE
ncbi:ABC transporter permease [Olivibacter ginsenosidimutans]|uniref:ABC transporter permease n=1 Tax=Olivibacter ginsenosidimutans TaxID=1176537 RepID=A0ABP9C2M3_9SPHI